MNFSKPTTKEQMFSVLKEIFYYYRIKKADFEKETLSPIELTRLDYTPLSDLKLLEKAGELVSCEQQMEIIKIKASINQEIEDCKTKKTQLTKAYNLTVEKIANNFTKSAYDIKQDAIKRGVGLTSVVTSQLAELESKKNQDLSDAEQSYLAEYGFYESKETQLTNRYERLEDEYTQVFDSQRKKKFLELKDEQEKLKREVFKYNNALDEKEQRSKNAIAQSNATLQIKYIEISSGSLSKDQLIEMGYYADVIDCVCAYYDTLEPLTAWRSIINDAKVAVYLEEYYNQVVYMYESRVQAG